jgi:hypothetical protein
VLKLAIIDVILGPWAMWRRDLIKSIAVSFIAWPVGVRAQQPRAMRTVGFLGPSAMRHSRSIILTGFGGAAIAAFATMPGWAASVRETFENHGLLGIFAQDCSQPAGPTNGYAVYRAIDDDHVQRDTMNSSTTSVRALIADSVTDTGPNEIQASGATAEGWPFSYTLHFDGPRQRVLTLVVHGNTIALDGIFQANNKPVAWATKCNSN